MLRLFKATPLHGTRGRTATRAGRMPRLTKSALFAIVCLFLAATPADADYALKHEDLPDALLNYIHLASHDPWFLHDQMAKGDPARGDADIRNVFATLARRFEALGHGLPTRIGFGASLCKIQSQSPGFFCGDDGARLSPSPHTNLVYVTTPVAAANDSIFLILSGVSPEGTAIVEFPQEGVPRVIYDYGDRYEDSNICVLDKDMSPLRSIYHIRVAGNGIFRMRESGNVPRREGENIVTMVLSGGKCAISAETIIPFSMR